MRAQFLTVSLIPLAALAACSGKSAGDAEPAATATVNAGPVDSGPALPAPLPTVTETVTAAAAPAAPTASEAAPVATIPAPAQGRFGLVAADCTSTRGDAKGLITVGPARIKFYESVAVLKRVHERSASRIRAAFAFEGEGMQWTHDVVLDAQNGGKVLIMRQYGGDVPGPLRYTRCS